MAEIDYGLDAPKLVRRFTARAAMFIAFAAILYVANRSGSPAAVAPLASVLFAIGLIFASVAGVMVLSSRVVKPKICNRILDSIPWRGDENVLDVGCGRGLFLVGAAKRLKTGKATGVDIWQSGDLSGNSAEAAQRNAKTEGVAGRVKIETADARELPFAAGSFDVVVSSLALHNLPSSQERAKALNEIARVLKPGGYLAILDIFRTAEYAKTLKQLSFTDVRLSPLTFLWCAPTRTLTARKAP
jgi:arsenite methyltransferase